ncbi:MAG: Glycosyl transferase [Candidatus Gallionella acididurans]|uniref:Glycosyl transferase n=1 Tax=Candidatus Gallionella acididurans TaxID=1796491 RepID=A0A139BSW9_9PROT|nr:MAG: Glycosyl transferase [Candidatus Gallionella acididurans]
MGIEIFDEPAEIEQFHCDRPISKLMMLIWQSRKDFQNTFDLNTKAGQETFINWYDVTVNRKHRLNALKPWLSRASQWLPVAVRNKAKYAWFRVMAKGVRVTSGSAHSLERQVQQVETKLGSTELQFYGGDPGVNLIGYAHAELGLGEHVRKSAAALSTTDVPFGVVDFGAGTVSRQQALLDHGLLIDSNKHKVNLFHLTADQIFPVYLHLGRNFFERRYNIGYPFWELSKFPLEWIPPMQLMDEVWAPTTYIQKALSDALGKDVLYMPVGVALPKISQLGRNHFGIPEDQYTFFFAFDFLSFIVRKNPYAVVAAFKKAFPLGNEKAGLIMKAMNAKESSDSWKRLVHDIGRDKRIRLINETMDKATLLSFKSECDCYISLHRAEGLGLGPLEAMLLGKPVIVTNYSGNTDYAKLDNSCLVDYTLIPVQEGQYLFHENQVWADPDIEHAAWHMKRLANDPEFGIALGKKAAVFVAANFSPAYCGQLYKRRLQELGML